MTIECTEEEKEAICILAETNDIDCIFGKSPNIICKSGIKCKDCAEKNIEWKIKEYKGGDEV